MDKFPESPLMGKNVSVIRLKGTPWKATLFDGTQVYRSKDDILEVPFNNDPAHRVRCASYDNHFVYKIPDHIQGWGLMCTCGSPAGITGARVYKEDASLSMGKGLVPGEMVLCLFHAETGSHADGAS